jgi:hypothetical protein
MDVDENDDSAVLDTIEQDGDEATHSVKREPEPDRNAQMPAPIKRRGPGRPPKNGIMSKREERLLKKQQQELAKKVVALPPQGEPPIKRKVGRPRKHPLPEDNGDKPEKRKYKPRKPKGEDGAEGSDGEKAAKEKRREKPKTPPLELDRANFTEDQVQKPNKNYGVLIDEVLTAAPDGLTLKQIYKRIQIKYPFYYFSVDTKGWESSVRHNLIGNDAFKKNEETHLWSRVPGIDIDAGKKRKAPSPDTTMNQHGYMGQHYTAHMAGQGMYSAEHMAQQGYQMGQMQHGYAQNYVQSTVAPHVSQQYAAAQTGGVVGVTPGAASGPAAPGSQPSGNATHPAHATYPANHQQPAVQAQIQNQAYGQQAAYANTATATSRPQPQSQPQAPSQSHPQQQQQQPASQPSTGTAAAAYASAYAARPQAIPGTVPPGSTPHSLAQQSAQSQAATQPPNRFAQAPPANMSGVAPTAVPTKPALAQAQTQTQQAPTTTASIPAAQPQKPILSPEFIRSVKTFTEKLTVQLSSRTAGAEAIILSAINRALGLSTQSLAGAIAQQPAGPGRDEEVRKIEAMEGVVVSVFEKTQKATATAAEPLTLPAGLLAVVRRFKERWLGILEKKIGPLRADALLLSAVDRCLGFVDRSVVDIGAGQKKEMESAEDLLCRELKAMLAEYQRTAAVAAPQG